MGIFSVTVAAAFDNHEIFFLFFLLTLHFEGFMSHSF